MRPPPPGSGQTAGQSRAMVTKKPKGLGLGLEAVLGPTVGDAPAAHEAAPPRLRLDRIRPGRYQPRTRMDEGSLYELAESIRSQGVMQPILVRPLDPAAQGAGADAYEIIAGERSDRAARLGGQDEGQETGRKVPDAAA